MLGLSRTCARAPRHLPSSFSVLPAKRLSPARCWSRCSQHRATSVTWRGPVCGDGPADRVRCVSVGNLPFGDAAGPAGPRHSGSGLGSDATL